jgi:hypothetical protein
MTATWYTLFKPLVLGVGLVLASLWLLWSDASPVGATAGPTCTVCSGGGTYPAIQAALDDSWTVAVRGGSYAPLNGEMAGVASSSSASPWIIFTPSTSLSPNRLANPGFEVGPAGWAAYGSGYVIDTTGGRNGGRALKLVNSVSDDAHGAFQVIALNQTEPRPLYFSGWSRAEGVSGAPDINYSLYLDIRYTDDTWLFGQIRQFDTCSLDWQFREGYIVPSKPVKEVFVYALLRWTHRGAVWFDDLSVQEVYPEMVFDSVPVSVSHPIAPPYGGPDLSLATGNGLTVALAAQGGAVTTVMLGGVAVNDPEHAYASGFFVRDVASQSNFMHVGGGLTKTGKQINHTSTILELALDFSATYTAAADRILVHAEVTNTRAGERAVTLYFALPISATQAWTWDDDIRLGRPIAGEDEFASFSVEHTGLGANGHLSRYPWAGLSGPAGGIALGVPLDSPRVMRLIYDPVTHQFYAAFDLGLSPATTKFPNRAWVDFIIYRFDHAEWGFRAGTQGYYERFPEAFTRRMPSDREGIWVAFSKVCTIENVLDFGIAFHELIDLAQVPCDDEQGIFSFRYLAEPWSAWLPINSRPLINPGFEDGPPGVATGWFSFTIDSNVYTYSVDEGGGRTGGRAIVLTSPATDTTHGARQPIHLGQSTSWPLYFNSWSRALSVTGEAGEDYSLYLDVFTPAWASKYVFPFDTGSHGWQFREGFAIPGSLIQDISLHCLLRGNHNGTGWFDDIDLWEISATIKEVSATANSAFFDECGRYRYETTSQPWCNGPAGCAVFTVNPDPDIQDPNKAHLVWNPNTLGTYQTWPTLDGEYVDSFLSHATTMDFRTDHFAAADVPLAYRTGNWRVGVPEAFATVEFSRWLAGDVHAKGKWTMANWILRDLSWGADLFDVMGTEIDWIDDSVPPDERFKPESDATLSYRRTLAYQRPYDLLMNTNFDNLTHGLVERYFQVALFYGFYPSMFSHNAADNPYWDNPSLYNRDRDLFKRYIPLIRRLNVAGWQPIPYARTDNPAIYVERFGGRPNLYFTLRNTSNESVPVTVTLMADALGIAQPPLTATLLPVETQVPLSSPGLTRTLTVTLPPTSTVVLYLHSSAVSLPIVFKNS